jgi:hypothetical protein
MDEKTEEDFPVEAGLEVGDYKFSNAVKCCRLNKKLNIK